MSVLTTNVPLVLMTVFGPGGGGGGTVLVTVSVLGGAVDVTVTAAGRPPPHPVRTTAIPAMAVLRRMQGRVAPRAGTRRGPVAAAILDRLGRDEHAATIAGFAAS